MGKKYDLETLFNGFAETICKEDELMISATENSAPRQREYTVVDRAENSNI